MYQRQLWCRLNTKKNSLDGQVELETGSWKVGNWLGQVIKLSSLHEGKGFEKDASWCTSAFGAGKEPPSDVAHHQFKSEVAFYLVWKNGGDQFALVTEQGENLASGEPTGTLPPARQRRANWQIFTEDGVGKIAKAALQWPSSQLPVSWP